MGLGSSELETKRASVVKIYLLRKCTNFSCTQKAQQSFDNIKQALTSDTVIAYFDKNKETELFTDASPTTLSAIFSQ